MSHVQTISADALSSEMGASILDLTTHIWPPSEGDGPPSLNENLARWRSRGQTHFVIVEDERVRAHATIFRREIITIHGRFPVGALAAVCVHPDFRGRGWGADVVRAAFAYLPELGAECSLFQTGVPGFYEGLGARTVSNRFFFNEESPENPFWDFCAMVYPKEFAWPEGDIDLNGPGY